MDLKEVRKAVGKIQSNLFKNSNSFSVGMLKSHFKGTGLQFKEHQVYTFGDDTRFIDWKLLAKSTHPYIKTFEEERNVEITVVIDAAPTMLYGHEGVSKFQAALEICCLLYLLAKETNDFVHALIVTDSITSVPSSNGERGLTQFITTMQRLKLLNADGNVNLEIRPDFEREERKIYNGILKHVGKKREIVILSDLLNFMRPEAIEQLVKRNHVHCFRIISPIDEHHGRGIEIFGTFYGKSFLGEIHKASAQKSEEKYIKTINVKDRHLENFIREML